MPSTFAGSVLPNVEGIRKQGADEPRGHTELSTNLEGIRKQKVPTNLEGIREQGADEPRGHTVARSRRT